MQVVWFGSSSFLALSCSGLLVHMDVSSGKELGSASIKISSGGTRLYCNADAHVALVAHGAHISRVVVAEQGLQLQPVL